MPPYCPKRGDIIWITFSPQVGHEQGGRRPALALSQDAYNRKVGLAVVCPVTSKSKGYPFEVQIPHGLRVAGTIMPDQIKNIDWNARNAEFFCRVPAAVMSEVLEKLNVLFS